MSRVLLVKLTSMGDLIHALPALTDAAKAIPDISFDWIVDESFYEVATWHPRVNQVFKTAHRRWRKNLRKTWSSGEFSRFYADITATEYDAVIDGQSNFKSAFVTRLCRGPRHGYDKNSVREKVAHFAYQHKHPVSRNAHAIDRLRQLFAQSLNYPVPDSAPDYGLSQADFGSLPQELPNPFLFGVHNASWPSKLWQEHHWKSLIELVNQAGYHFVFPCGNDTEHQRARRIIANNPNATALPRYSLTQTAAILNQAAGAVCSDTGLGHLAAALGIPAVHLYGSTSTALIGATGDNQRWLLDDSYQCSPCYQHYCHQKSPPSPDAECMQALAPAQVWEALRQQMAQIATSAP